MKTAILYFFLLLSTVLSAEQITLDNGFAVNVGKVGHGPIQLLLIPGGPGMTHEYFEIFEKYLPEAEFTFYYYDPLDTYFSEQIGDESYWTIENYTAEIEQVRKALGLKQFFLFGHSWGGLITIEYALKYPEYLQGIIIANMTASIESYIEYTTKLKEALPENIKSKILAFEKDKDFENPEYFALLYKNLYGKHLCRTRPVPEALTRTMHHKNELMYQKFQYNEFNIKEAFQWNRWDDLSKIQVPTLIIGAIYDTMNPDDLILMGQLIPNAEVTICEDSGHCTLYDNSECFFHALKEFLKRFK